MKGSVVTVFGAGGFVGRYVVQALLDAGARVKAAVRNPATAMHLKPLGDLGQLELIAADVRGPGSVFAALEGADAAINLVGSFADMDAINAKGAGTVAHAAKAAGVSRLVHISAIGADADSAAGATAVYARSKAGGEAAVRRAFADATILRPSIVFGREDAFINRFAGLIRMLPVVPVIGADTRFQPVFVGDVARAVVAALAGAGGRTLELGGPETYSMLELNQWIARAIGQHPPFIPVPHFAAKMLTFIPKGPISGDQLKMLASDNVVSGEDGLAALGIVPTPLDAVAHDWLNIYRKHGRFGQRAATA